MADALTSPPDENSIQPDSATDQQHSGKYADDSSSVLQDWLDWQCRMLDGVVRASLFSIKPGAAQVYADSGQAQWPCSATDSTHLIPHANAAIQKRATVVNKLSRTVNGRPLECVSIPLPAEQPCFVLSALIAPRQPLRHADLAKLVQWGGYWLSGHVEAATSQWLSILAECASSQSLLESQFHIVTRLAEAFDCERVSLGLLDGPRVRLKTVSGLPRFDQRMRLVSQIEQVMDEAIELEALVDSSGNSIGPNSLHGKLAARQAGYCISIPLADTAGRLGVITLERNESRQFDDREKKALSTFAASVTPLMRLRIDVDKGIGRRLGAAMLSVVTRHNCQSLNVRPATRTITAFCVVALLLASVMFKGEYRITSSVIIEGADKQVVVAPYAGFILAAGVRAGEEVSAGQVLASLDVSGLQVEKEKWLSELNKLDKRYSQALASGDRIDLSLVSALREELTAELELVGQRIDRSQVKAPFRGMVVSGDLNQLLGAPVEQGELLFEIASMDQFRLMVDIEEHAIADISEGQPGAVRLAAMPGVTHDVVLKTQQPVAVSESGKNVFRMEAEFVSPSPGFRPGMQGVAKISAGKKPWLWLWTHKLVNRLRVWLWTIGF